MSVIDFIKTLDSSELANLLCIIYNIGLLDKGEDKSSAFTEEFMNSDKDKLYEFLDTSYNELFR